jgi:TnpA family transposase
MRIAVSLKLGAVQASKLIRSLLKSGRPSCLAQAIIEAGRINKAPLTTLKRLHQHGCGSNMTTLFGCAGVLP